MCLLIIGLILNTIGAILLTISSIVNSNFLTKLIAIVGKGTWDSMSEVTEAIKPMERMKRLSLILNILGLVLFLVGFILQLIPNL